jgi:multidrug efflux pump subunit AcrB
MNGGLSTPFIKFPIATSLIMVAILFVGLVAYENLPVAPLPKVDFPTIQVSALLPGASPETMASSVARCDADHLFQRARHHHGGGAIRPRP